MGADVLRQRLAQQAKQEQTQQKRDGRFRATMQKQQVEPQAEVLMQQQRLAHSKERLQAAASAVERVLAYDKAAAWCATWGMLEDPAAHSLQVQARLVCAHNCLQACAACLPACR